jgi:hypothetical protein
MAERLTDQHLNCLKIQPRFARNGFCLNKPFQPHFVQNSLKFLVERKPLSNLKMQIVHLIYVIPAQAKILGSQKFLRSRNKSKSIFEQTARFSPVRDNLRLARLSA